MSGAEDEYVFDIDAFELRRNGEPVDLEPQVLEVLRYLVEHPNRLVRKEELLAERGVDVDHVTIYWWVQRFTPLVIDAARPCRHSVGDRWFVGETYVRVAGVCRRTANKITSGGNRKPANEGDTGRRRSTWGRYGRTRSLNATVPLPAPAARSDVSAATFRAAVEAEDTECAQALVSPTITSPTATVPSTARRRSSCST